MGTHSQPTRQKLPRAETHVSDFKDTMNDSSSLVPADLIAAMPNLTPAVTKSIDKGQMHLVNVARRA